MWQSRRRTDALWMVGNLCRPFLLLLLACSGALPAAEPPRRNLIDESRLVQFEIVHGRIVARNTRFGQSRGASKKREARGLKESLSLRIHAGKPAVKYVRRCTKRCITVDCTAKRDFRLQSEPLDETQPHVVFFQPVRGLCQLTVAEPNREATTVRASTLWHLSLCHPGLYQRHLLPLLKIVCPSWRLGEFSAQLSSQMLQIAASDDYPDEGQVWALIEKMSDRRFQVRQEADRQMRALGLAALGYLKSVRRGDVSAEQFRRVQSIRRSLRVRNADTPVTVAVWLRGDREAWDALANQPAPLQQQARRHLARISLRK